MLHHIRASALERRQPHPWAHRDLDAGETSFGRRLVWLSSPASWTSRINVSQFAATRANVSATGSRFERVVLRASEVAPNLANLLDVLLASTSASPDRGCKVLRPLWVEEAVHRAYNFVRLVAARNRDDSHPSGGCHLGDATAWEDAIACDLAIRFRELATRQERERLPCSAILRDVVSALGALFGSSANVAFEARIDDVCLPGYKRRALVLATCELVCNALLHAFRGCAANQIEVHLTVTGPESACLRVADNGIGFSGSAPNFDHGVGAGLAGLLEADLVYGRIAGWTIAEIAFALPA